MTNNNEIVMMLMGGFGNQLFQLCQLNEYKNLNIKVYADTSNFARSKKEHNTTNRELVLPVQLFQINELSTYKRFTINTLEKIQKSKIFPFKLNFYQEINDYNWEHVKLRKFNKAIGYWQNSSLITKNKQFLIKSLSKEDMFLEAFNKGVEKGSTVLHVRRGDYLKLNENLSNKFYENSLNFCSQNIENFHYNVFTDDKNWVESNKLFKDANNIFSDDENIESVKKSFANMLNNENYIVGNSTFPLVAALLSETASSKVLVADPWFRNKEKNLNLNQNWIKIENV
tara:strand:- start:3044 stop:3898 length:855 start_codon:yes stop_codon:yes gene_type:complete